jgi:hypothetical protein
VPAHHILDEHGLLPGAERDHLVLQGLADRNDRARIGERLPLEALEDRKTPAPERVPEVRELLGQARVHVVQVRHPETPRDPGTEEPGLLVGMHDVVAPATRRPQRGDQQQPVEQQLHDRWADADATHERQAGRADDPQVRQLDIRPDRIRDQVHLMPQINEGLDAVEFAEGRAPGLEKRLRRQHQDAKRTGSVGQCGPRIIASGAAIVLLCPVRPLES